ncbi:hypothetical protein ABIF64_008508 [Bradyrhizobium japonicum]|jgi:hypothetical protein|nr:hypothetical protein [Bradyrhizobium japonicum]MCP1785793.1 hypothetical protein [Bradyrhizobium japonicum]MCP1807672.1 hypothetical protein [Bradyrhizobium japonicum]MCP1816599.1 hypothetical protein [Bradyrhizobium japonicum]MCP1871888.1 hypothetical protein [Bradyrhizobium japonicum]
MNGTRSNSKYGLQALDGQQKQEYRAYIMGLDGHIEVRIDLMCEDETEAKKRARSLADGCDVELWCQDRKVSEFKSE